MIENTIRDSHPHLFYATKTKKERLENDMQIYMIKQQYIREHVDEINRLILEHKKNKNSNKIFIA